MKQRPSLSWNNVIPGWLLFPQEPCFLCKHSYTAHRKDVGCIGPKDPADDAASFFAGHCKKECKRYIKDNLDYLAYKYETKDKSAKTVKRKKHS